MRTIHNYFTLASLKSLNSSIHLKKKKLWFGKLSFDVSFLLFRLLLVTYFNYNIIISKV